MLSFASDAERKTFSNLLLMLNVSESILVHSTNTEKVSIVADGEGGAAAAATSVNAPAETGAFTYVTESELKCEELKG